ncbi:MAG: SgcJ/EcaC family oxidoreductase [Bacteroidota bacterium]
MPRFALVLAVLLLLAPASIAQPSAAPSADEAAIAEAAASFSAAFMQGDADTMAALYTEDAVIFPERRPAIEGREAIRAYWTLGEGRTITNHHITPTSVDVVGDRAYDHGLYTVSGTSNGEAWGPSYGKYLIVWKRGADGAWRMHLDMWNSTPAPETE